MPELPEWARYWRDHKIIIVKAHQCFVCEEYISSNRLAMVKGDRFYCADCAEELYRCIREDLLVLDRYICQIATGLGHNLKQFKPGLDCDQYHGILVAECQFCLSSVCYEVVDIIHNHQLAKHHPIVVGEPIGFPIKNHCWSR